MFDKFYTQLRVSVMLIFSVCCRSCWLITIANSGFTGNFFFSVHIKNLAFFAPHVLKVVSSGVTERLKSFWHDYFSKTCYGNLLFSLLSWKSLYGSLVDCHLRSLCWLILLTSNLKGKYQDGRKYLNSLYFLPPSPVLHNLSLLPSSLSLPPLPPPPTLRLASPLRWQQAICFKKVSRFWYMLKYEILEKVQAIPAIGLCYNMLLEWLYVCRYMCNPLRVMAIY